MNTLFIVSTPIGNLKDITYRAVETLRNVQVIFAEDTRKTKKLLFHYEIKTSLKSYHEHNVEKAIPLVLKELEVGDVALVSDSGTPLISDPGYKLVREVLAQGGSVTAIPGASAVLTALVTSGLPTDKFCFRGFLPRKRGQLEAEFRLIEKSDSTVIYYESPHRILKTLEILQSILGESRVISVANELTKFHEHTVTGHSSDILKKLALKGKVKGEFVLLISKSSK